MDSSVKTALMVVGLLVLLNNFEATRKLVSGTNRYF